MATKVECLVPQDIYGSDPLIRTLVERWNFSPAKWALTVILFGLSYMGVLALAFGYLFPREGIIASSRDVFNQLNFLIIFPGIAFYYLWQPLKIVRTYTVLLSSIRNQCDEMDEQANAIRKLAVGKAWWLICLALGLLMIAAGTYDCFFKFGRWWYAANWLMILGLQLARGFIIYMVTITFARHLAVSLRLNQIYNHFDILSPILPPSQTYGIHAVSNYANGFVVFVALIGLNIGLAPVLSTRLEIGYPYQAAFYLILSGIAFLLPLWGAHSEMVKSKNHLLDNLSFQYQNEYNQTLMKLANRDQVIEDSFKRLKSIEEAYELAKRCWVWPFNTSMPIKVTLTILAPLGVVITQAVQGFLSNLISNILGS